MKVLRLYNNQNGIALMIVLWVLVLLTALATEFAFSMKGEVNASRNFKEDAESYYLAKAGIQLGIAEVLMPAGFHTINSDSELVIGQPFSLPKNSQAEGSVPLINTYQSSIRKNITLGNGTIKYKLEDENSKIPINRASRKILVKVLTITGMEAGEKRDIIADSILDWIDVDKNHRLNGAENQFYQNLNPSYFAKNGPIENLDELKKIRGIDENLFYGNDQFLGLNQLFTIYNVKSINPNTASPEVLSVLFSKSQAKKIMNTREEKGFYNNTTSDFFRIRSTGKINKSPTNHTIHTVVQKYFVKNEPTLLTHYWNDNNFKTIHESVRKEK